MSFYLDTSLLIAVFTNEAASERARDWLERHQADIMIVSWWSQTEIASALSIKVRSGQIDARQRALVATGLAELIDTAVATVEVTHAHFVEAAALLDDASLGLRAGDALHLAIARSNGMRVCTMDRRFAEAGAALGLETILID
ncbi:MAG: type II toxin-antitoxin system VapC family toxin [Mesorhizobium sp.]